MGATELRVAVISVGIVLQFVILYTGLTVQLTLDVLQPDGYVAIPKHGQVYGNPCTRDEDCSPTTACNLKGLCNDCRTAKDNNKFVRDGNYCKDNWGIACSTDDDCPDKSTVCKKKKCEKCQKGYYRRGNMCVDLNECCKYETQKPNNCSEEYNPCRDRDYTHCVNTEGGYLCSFEKAKGQVSLIKKTTPKPKEDDGKPTVVKSAPIQSADAKYIWWMMGCAIAALLIIFIGRTAICLKKNFFSSKKLDIEDDNEEMIQDRH